MPLNIIAVSYQDLCSKGLISKLKKAANCDVKNVCRLSCNRCPNVFAAIDLEKIVIKRLNFDYAVIIKTDKEDDFELHLSAPNIHSWLKTNNIPYQQK